MFFKKKYTNDLYIVKEADNGFIILDLYDFKLIRTNKTNNYGLKCTCKQKMKDFLDADEISFEEFKHNIKLNFSVKLDINVFKEEKFFIVIKLFKHFFNYDIGNYIFGSTYKSFVKSFTNTSHIFIRTSISPHNHGKIYLDNNTQGINQITEENFFKAIYFLESCVLKYNITPENVEYTMKKSFVSIEYPSEQEIKQPREQIKTIFNNIKKIKTYDS